MTTYSNSLLDTYEQCPLKYKLRYRDKIKRKFDTVESFLGTMIHRTLRKCYNDYTVGRGKDIDGALGHFSTLWNNRWNDSIIMMKKGRTQEDYRLHGEELLYNYYRHYYPFDSDTTIDTELSISFFLDNTNKYRMIGYIDRLSKTIDGVVQIHDYKTSAKLPAQAEIDIDRQLALYQMGVQQRWPDYKSIRLIWHYLSFDTEMVSSRSPEAISELSGKTIKLIDEIESASVFPPRESGLCGWCEYPDLCPLRKNYVKEKPPAEIHDDNEPGLFLVDMYAFLINRVESTDREIEKAVIALLEYAHSKEIMEIKGTEYKVLIKPENKLLLPGVSDSELKELKNIIDERGKWSKVFQADIASLTSIVDSKLLSNEFKTQVIEYQNKQKVDVIQLVKLSD